ncbi:hypothetical protein GMDG_08951, partial [Pseudogymnoascus destructans 20631-21]
MGRYHFHWYRASALTSSVVMVDGIVPPVRIRLMGGVTYRQFTRVVGQGDLFAPAR